MNTPHKLKTDVKWATDKNGNVIGYQNERNEFRSLEEIALLSAALTANLSTKDIVINSIDYNGINLPNPYPSQTNAPVHPAILYFSSGWNSYKYWMVYTPYPGAASDYENPTLAASNDGITWIARGRQPLIDKPLLGYNADTHLFMSPDESIMYIAFRERITTGPAPGQLNSIKVMQSTDGVNWTDPVTILSGAINSVDFGSPSFWWNGTNWVCLSHQLDAGSPWPVRRSVSSTSDIYGAWDAATTVTIPPLSGRAWWHSFNRRLASGQIVGIFQDNAGSAGSSGNLYWCESVDDGVTFAVGDVIPINLAGYRSTFLSYELNGKTNLELYLGDVGVFKIYRCLAELGAINSRRNFFNAQASLLGGLLVPNRLWYDTFTRADSASSLGTSSSGGTYTASSGIWGISSNRAYPVSSGRVLANVSTSDHEVSVKFEDMTTAIQQWLICRATDGSNYWRCGVINPSASGTQTLVLQSIVAGGIVLNVAIGKIQRGDTLTLRAAGTTIKVFVNGVLATTYPVTSSLGGTSIGMQANAGATSFFDNFTCTAL